MNAARGERANDAGCCEPGCPYDASFQSPQEWCDWHWHLWFAFGDDKLAGELIRDTRALRSPQEIRDAGHQCPITHPIALVRDGSANESEEDSQS